MITKYIENKRELSEIIFAKTKNIKTIY